MRTALLVVIFACNSSSPPPAPSPSPAAARDAASVSDATCAQSIENLERVRKAPAGALDEVKKDCEQQPWSAPYRRCINAVVDKAGIYKCDRAALIARGVDMGGPACTDVIDHLAVVEKLPPDSFAKARELLLMSCTALPRAVKECSMKATEQQRLAACASKNDTKR